MKIPCSRADAKAVGSKHYFNSRPCPKGHISPRFTSTGSCCECLKIISASSDKKEYDKKYQAKNEGRIQARCAARYAANRPAFLKKAKMWAEKNPESRRAIANSYKARRRAIEGAGMSGSELKSWICKQEKICFWCDAAVPTGYHIDHFVPLSRGGPHRAENLVISCKTCNLRKQARDPFEFAASLCRHGFNHAMLEVA